MGAGLVRQVNLPERPECGNGRICPIWGLARAQARGSLIGSLLKHQ